MVWAPKEEIRTAVLFWLDTLKIITVAGGVVAAFLAWSNYRTEQEKRASEETTRATEQARRSEEQLQAITRELQRPYQEKKLVLYLEAARVVAHLAATPDVNKEATEARFWELYWGELAFVESTTEMEGKGGPKPSVERLMVEFCHQYFLPERCGKGGSPESPTGSAKMVTRAAEPSAINLARNASREIRDEWERLGSSLKTARPSPAPTR